jgi:hypothetical protein
MKGEKHILVIRSGVIKSSYTYNYKLKYLNKNDYCMFK